MRVLWFTNTPSSYLSVKGGYNGGGWISSLEDSLSQKDGIELGICFFYSKTDKIEQNGVTYYPVNPIDGFKDKIRNHFAYESHQKKEVRHLLRVVEDFKPDLIHFFGSENSFGLIKAYTQIPAVLHIQGILIPYLNAFTPPRIGLWECIRHLKIRDYFSKYLGLRFFKRGAKREKEIFKLCNNYMGRTEWDKSIVNILSPYSKYYYCSEILRTPFYNTSPWKLPTNNKFRLLTTISKVEYKGFDLVLKTAHLLKNNLNIDFEWIVCGIDEYGFWERTLGINNDLVNVKLAGVVNAEQLIDLMHQSDVFVHPSYIDNSPNSVCEAQLLGMPVISTNVGGISSLIADGITGCLVPANDPFTLAQAILNLKNDDSKKNLLGQNAREVSLKRHDVEDIVNTNIQIYNTILKDR